ncbi:MAG: hypothetical protein RBT75_20215 [Anaerolineae bacterium]|nr:hypothetical protein [Anaerolineae bacterium]
MNIIERLDRVGAARPIVLGVTLWLTYSAYTWATGFAELSQRSGAEIALIVAAATAPIIALQAFTFKMYLDSMR